MKKSTPALVIVLACGACGFSFAQRGGDLAAYAQLPFCTLSADGTRLAVEPCRTAPPKSPMPRRPVFALIQPMPTVGQAPQVRAPSISTPAPSPVARGPQPVMGCDAGGCRDASGVRHITGAGNATTTPSGRLCNINGVWLQCS